MYSIFDLGSFAATCYGAQQLNANNVGVPAMNHVAGWCSWPVAVSPGTWPRGVPGFLAGSALCFGFAAQLFDHAPECLTGLTCKRASLQFKNSVQIFTLLIYR